MTEFLTFWVDIENAAGDKLGAGRIMPAYFDTIEPLSAADLLSLLYPQRILIMTL